MATISTTARPAYVYDAGGDQWVPIAWTVLGSGSASAPALTFTGDSNTGLWSPAADTVAFSTGGVERLRIDNAGNVGIGTTSPANSLVIYNGNGVIDVNRFVASTTTGPTIITRKSASSSVGTQAALANGEVAGRLVFQGSDGTAFIDVASIRAEVDGGVSTNDMPGRLVFLTTADGSATLTERMRITNAGNVGIGTSAPGGPLEIYRATGDSTIAVTGDSSSYMVVRTAVTSTGAPLIFMDKARGTIASPSIVSSGDSVGVIRFRGHDGVNYRNLAQIQADVDTTPGSGDMPGRLTFSTTPDGSTTITERMRIDNAGLITGTGTSLGAWTAYTPTLGGTGWAIGDGTVTGRYCQIGKVVLFEASVTFGGTSTFGGSALNISLPVTANGDQVNGRINVYYTDASASKAYQGSSSWPSTTAITPRSIGTSGETGTFTTSAPIAWATSDAIQISGTYQAA